MCLVMVRLDDDRYGDDEAHRRAGKGARKRGLEGGENDRRCAVLLPERDRPKMGETNRKQ